MAKKPSVPAIAPPSELARLAAESVRKKNGKADVTEGQILADEVWRLAKEFADLQAGLPPKKKSPKRLGRIDLSGF